MKEFLKMSQLFGSVNQNPKVEKKPNNVLADLFAFYGPEDNAGLPDWINILSEVIKETHFIEDTSKLEFIDRENPYPFEEIFIPFVIFCRQNISQANAYKTLLDSARIDLERGLLALLSGYMAQPFYYEFHIYRSCELSPLYFLANEGRPSCSIDVYSRFVKNNNAIGLLSFFENYPVAARIVGILTKQWIDSQTEFLNRLSKDSEELKRVFADGKELGPIVRIDPFCSDRHKNGRSVIIVEFSSGVTILYKPKSLKVDVLFNGFWQWLNKFDSSINMMIPRFLCGEGYGWMSYISNDPCLDEIAIARYYRRAGMLLCITHLLNGTDCHRENLIACGECPVLVDVETLFHPNNNMNVYASTRNARSVAQEKLDNSVLRTGFLPIWQQSIDNKTVSDESGFGGNADPASLRRVIYWENINTDQMKLGFEETTIPVKINLPMIGDKKIPFDGYIDDFVGGFEQIYRLLTKHKRELLMPECPLHDFQNMKVRFVFRATKIYVEILKRALLPENLRNGKDFKRAIQTVLTLHFATKRDGATVDISPLLKAELRSLANLDIPYFTHDIAGESLDADTGTRIDHFFKLSSYEKLLKQIEGLNEDDLAYQTQIIKTVFKMRQVREAHSPECRNDLKKRSRLKKNQLYSADLFVSSAINIAKEIEEHSIRGSDESVTWIAPQYSVQNNCHKLQVIGSNLYDGLIGIALFLATLNKITNREHYRNLLVGIYASIKTDIQDKSSGKFNHYGLGGTNGLGSLLYGIVKINQMIQLPGGSEMTNSVLNEISLDKIKIDNDFDVISGAAGAILGLVNLYSVTKSGEALEKAILCGNHLLSKQVVSPEGMRCWATIGGNLLTGFSHGAAGIAYSLLRLYEVTGKKEFFNAACDGFNYEESVFTGNHWPDLRLSREDNNDQNNHSINAWCHGATGIGLARIGCLHILDSIAIRNDIEISLKNTINALENEKDLADHLCCGNMGRIEFLLSASEKLLCPDLASKARNYASELVMRAEKVGYYKLSSSYPEGIFHPGLFQGISGIGYQLLRLVNHSEVSSLLLWK